MAVNLLRFWQEIAFATPLLGNAFSFQPPFLLVCGFFSAVIPNHANVKFVTLIALFSLVFDGLSCSKLQDLFPFYHTFYWHHIDLYLIINSSISTLTYSRTLTYDRQCVTANNRYSIIFQVTHCSFQTKE